MRMNRPICVTGASGFLAAHVVRELLERGYRVRGTVRGRPAPGTYGYLRSLPGASDRLELLTAELLAEGSYDAAISGCDIVIHTASPYVVNVKDPQRDLVEPAENGTLNVLRSARSAGVRRVVLTSSLAAITDEPIEGKVFTESDWNERSSLDRNPYYFSKAVAERSAWRFVQTEAPGFDLIAVNPFMILGPSLGPELNTTNSVFRDILTGVYPGILSLTWGFVDVRDAATAHVLAMASDRAKGRYICAGDTLSMRTSFAAGAGGYRDGYKLPRLDLTGPIGTFVVKLLSYTQAKGTGSYLRTHLGRTMRYDNSKIRNELGITFRPARESVIATVEDLVRWGHLAPKA